MTDDFELLHRYSATGDPQAFSAFVGRHLGHVLGSAARRLGDDHRAREVAQEVFIRAARHARALSTHPNVAAWLFAATRNAALNLMRDEKRRSEREAAAALHVETMTSHKHDAWDDIRMRLEPAIDKLRAPDRDAILLRFFSDLPLAEVGRQLGISENAARMRVQRALDRLSDSLVRSGARPSPISLASVLSAHVNTEVPGTVASAIASSAVAESTMPAAFAWIAFMSSSKTIPASLIFAAVVGGLATYQSIEVRAAHKEVREARQQADITSSVVTRLEREAAEAEADLGRRTRGTSNAVRAGTTIPATKSAASSPRITGDPKNDGAALIARHPELKAALVADSEARIRSQFHALIRELALTDDETKEFLRLRSANSRFSRSLSDGRIFEFSTGPDIPWREVDSALKALLGPDRYQRLIEYSRSLPARGQTMQLASGLYFTDAPLTLPQAKQVMEMLQRYQMPVPGGAPRVDWRGVRSEAEQFLSPTQLEALHSLEAEEALREKWRDRTAAGKVQSTQLSGGKP